MSYELLLLNLSRNAQAQSSHFRECIGQHMIAAYLSEHGFRAKVYSGDILDAEQVVRYELSEHGVRYIGFYVGADNIVMVGNFIRFIKDTTTAFCFVGGPEAVALGKSFLINTRCDAAIIGEGERSVHALLSYWEDGVGCLEEIGGLRYLDQEMTFHDVPLDDPIMDLDSLPWPKREDSLLKDFRMGTSIGVLTGRGCPFHCAFCYEGAACKQVRLRGIENVMAEIDDARSYNTSLAHVNFFDDTFTLYPERVSAFCRELKRRGLHWTCEGHVACLYHHPEIIEEMVGSGLIAMQIGIESGSHIVLEAYQKHTTPEMIESVVRSCHDAGLRTLEGNYIIGGAFETNDTLSESLAHAKRLLQAGRGMIELKTVFFAPYFGTPITKEPSKFGMRFLSNEIAHTVITMQEPVIETAALSTQDLIRWKEKFDRELREQYHLQAAQCTHDDIFRNGSYPKQGEVSSVSWYTAWLEIPHLQEFLGHATAAEQTPAHTKYPIRVGNKRKDPCGIRIDGIPLSPLQAQAWSKADGRLTITQLAQQLDLTVNETQCIYSELNHLCLVYFSPF